MLSTSVSGLSGHCACLSVHGDAMNIASILSVTRERLITVSDKAQLVDAASLLGSGRIDLVVVCEDTGKMAGVVTRMDIVSRISRCQGHACTASVASVMSRDVIYCRPPELLETAWKRMKEKGHAHIPVVDDDNRPLGTLNARDALQALLKETEYEEDLLRDYVMGIGYR
ncbi:CBS domain protein [Afipia carboxidovorans OM5]|uniref:CBS domain protein n=2 Tax=Afipia carboxidovorans TaxID=40137 RepID=F8BVF2_AFIC5|nr:CBS domain protein [Afipia carboxidovorans OM4]AEI05951.1 CBS domain protein [Afipia carboxidovorans OM5]